MSCKSYRTYQYLTREKGKQLVLKMYDAQEKAKGLFIKLKYQKLQASILKKM